MRVTQRIAGFHAPGASPPASADADAASLAPHRYFVVWGAPELGLYCLEPWLGGPNSLNTGDGRVDLPGGRAFSWAWSVQAV